MLLFSSICPLQTHTHTHTHTHTLSLSLSLSLSLTHTHTLSLSPSPSLSIYLIHSFTHFFYYQNHSFVLTHPSFKQPIILFPDDAEFRKCQSCRNGRVYYIKFSNDKRDFFWMQEFSSANDDVYCKKLNDIINGNMATEETNGIEG